MKLESQPLFHGIMLLSYEMLAYDNEFNFINIKAWRNIQ